MITLGLNAAFHDSAAALVIDGVPVAAAEEERFTRIKHAKRPLPFTAWELPFHAIVSCLEHAGLTMADVDRVAYSFDPWRFAGDRHDLPLGEEDGVRLPLAPGTRGPADLAPWDSPWDPLLLAYVLDAPGQLAGGAPYPLRQRLLPAGSPPTRWQWSFLDHHLCHQASAFLAAPFESCAVMTLDGRGERATTTYGLWRDGRYRTLDAVLVPHSLGLLYEQVTAHLGFLPSSDEYKVMALAAIGHPVYGDALADRLQLRSGGQFVLMALDLEALVGPPRVPGAPLRQSHVDLAASLQSVLERKVLKLAEWLRETTGEPALAMAGGVALNGVMNARLRDEGPFEAIWVQPAAGDAGTALGAALWTDARARARPAPDGDGAAGTAGSAGDALPLGERRWQMTHAALGPAWTDEAIESLLRRAGLAYETMADDAALCARTAELLAAERLVGWFQGRMEWGPRALGSRSILASPIPAGMRQRLNALKDREDFCPVAPAITAEAFGAWFTPAHLNGGRSPFMLFTHQVRPSHAARIPAACHSDGSARVQTVDAVAQPLFHALITAFGRRTGVPLVVNTSFSARGEPIVCSPTDAIETFFASPLDALAIGHFVLSKPAVPS